MVKLPIKKYKYFINLLDNRSSHFENESSFTLHFIQGCDIQHTWILNEWIVLGDIPWNVSVSTYMIGLNVKFIVFMLVNLLKIVLLSLIILLWDKSIKVKYNNILKLLSPSFEIIFFWRCNVIILFKGKKQLFWISVSLFELISKCLSKCKMGIFWSFFKHMESSIWSLMFRNMIDWNDENSFE